MATSTVPMPMSGFCRFPANAGGSYTSHDYCRKEGCTCSCHANQSKPDSGT
jgi:hypothetical protein